MNKKIAALRRRVVAAFAAGRRVAIGRFIGVCSCLVSLHAAAQPFPTPPLPGPPRPLAIAAPVEATLRNGLRVVVARREGVPLVSAELLVLAGAETDPPGRAGTASLAAALLTEGTRRRSAPEIAAAAEALGSSIVSSAGWNQSVVSMTVATPRLDAALGLIAEVVREPVFAAKEIERVRALTLDELKVTYANPGALAAIVAQRLTYGPGAYGQPARGTPKSLPLVIRDDLVAAHRRAFRPDNAVLILAGDITPAAALPLAERHLGSWSAAGARPPLAPAPTADLSSAPAAIVAMPSAGQAGVAFGLALPERDGNEPAVGAVLNAVLGGDYSARLNQEIRVRRGLSYGVGSGIEARRKSAFLRIGLQTKNESAAEVVGLVRAELDRLGSAPVEAVELATRKATLVGAFSRSVETTAGLAAAIGSLIVAGRAPAELTTRIDSYLTVSVEDVQRYAAAHLAASRTRIAVAGDAAAFGPALKSELPGSVGIEQDALDLDRPGLR